MKSAKQQRPVPIALAAAACDLRLKPRALGVTPGTRAESVKDLSAYSFGTLHRMAARSEEQLNAIIDKLVKDVELAVHAMYRGDVRQNTAKARTDGHRRVAYDALRPLISPTSAPALTAPGSSAAIPADEATAITRCILAWLPMGAPSAAANDSRCVAANRELFPTWGEREQARQAVKRLHG